MTIINFKIDEKKKKQIEELTEIKGYKSVSDFIRQIIDREMNVQKKIDDFLSRNPPFDRSKIVIPEYIPDGKFLGISRNAIVAVGDSAQEVAKTLTEKFPESASGIIHKGHEDEKIELLLSIFSISESKCFHQYSYKNDYYPLLRISMNINKEEIPLVGLLDTGATLIAVDKEIVEQYSFKSTQIKKIYTARGIVDVPIYKGVFKYEDKSMELQFICTETPKEFAFNALLGKNFVDNFNILFLGKEKLFCIQPIGDNGSANKSNK